MIEVELPDGSIAEFPDGTSEDVMRKALMSLSQGTAPPSPAQRIADAGLDMSALGPQPGGPELPANLLAGDRYQAPLPGSDRAQAAAEPRMGKGEAWLHGANQGLTFGFGDEMAAGLMSLAPGQSYDAALAQNRGSLEKAREDQPRAALASEVIGGIASPVGMIGTGAKGATLAKKVGSGALQGAGMGALYGFGAGEGGATERGKDAGFGALTGGIIGGGIPVLGALFQSGLRAGKDMLARSRVAGQGSEALGISPQAARVLSESLQMENPADMAAALNRAGPNAMLAEAAPGLQGQLDAAMRSPGRAARVAGERINARAESAGSALRSQLERSLVGDMPQPPAGRQFSDTARLQGDVRQATAGARAAVYDAAYAAPIDYSGKAGRDLEGLIPRIPAAVWRDADRLMQLDGDVSKQIMAQVADDGSVQLQRLPDVRQWDYVKRALDQAAASGEGQGALGGQTPLGRAYQGLARNIRGALGDAVPEYDYATTVAARAIDEVQAIKTGADMLRPGVTRAEVEASLDGASKQELAAVKRGLKQYIDDTLANVGAVASDQNVDAREAQKALAMLSSQASRDKLTLLLGEQAAPIFREIEQASSALGLRARTAGNSQTAGRMAADQMMNDAIDPSLLRQGKPVAAAKEAIATALGGSREAVNRLRGDAKADLADVLTRPGAAEILQTMQGIAGRNAVDPQTGSALRKLFETYMLRGAGVGAEQINSGISARMQPQPRG